MSDITNRQLLDSIAQMFVDMNERFDAMHQDFEEHRRKFDRHCEEFEKLHQEEHATERKVETLRSGIAEAAPAAQ